MGRRSFALHRWLGAAIAIQLLLWSVGGFIFATHSISWVRGKDEQRKQVDEPIPISTAELTPAEAAARTQVAKPIQVVLRTLLRRAVYEVRGEEATVLVDAETGALLSPLPRELAGQIAVGDRRDQPSILEASLLSGNPPTEYRGGELPAWRIALDETGNTNIYVSASTGRITARRNDAWRRFDFFWMLHTMDYSGRDNFNHPLLIAASSLAILSVASGFLLWALRLVRARRRRSRQDH